MSLNHIQTSIPDNEKLDVKFGIVYCDQVVTGSGPSPIADGYIDALTGASLSSPTTGISTSLVPSYTTGIKNHSTFVWTFKGDVNVNANVTNYYIDVVLPTSIQTYFDANPSAFATYFISANGMSNTIASSATFSANQMYYANEAVRLSANTVRVHMLSQTGNGSGGIIVLHNLNLQLIFSGPVTV